MQLDELQSLEMLEWFPHITDLVLVAPADVEVIPGPLAKAISEGTLVSSRLLDVPGRARHATRNPLGTPILRVKSGDRLHITLGYAPVAYRPE